MMKKPSSNASQKQAVKSYRTRLSARGIARFEVLGLEADRDLIRSLARQLAENGPEAAELRSKVRTGLAGKSRPKGGILAALRRSPLVGVDLGLTRSKDNGRDVDL